MYSVVQHALRLRVTCILKFFLLCHEVTEMRLFNLPQSLLVRKHLTMVLNLQRVCRLNESSRDRHLLTFYWNSGSTMTLGWCFFHLQLANKIDFVLRISPKTEPRVGQWKSDLCTICQGVIQNAWLVVNVLLLFSQCNSRKTLHCTN